MNNSKKIKLLIITQKINTNDDDLSFVVLWVKEFIKQGLDVQVICLEKGTFDNSFPVYSLGKEVGSGKFYRVLLFLKYIFTLKYDRVFVHMNPEYITLGGCFWFLSRKPIYLWYTHYTMHIHLWLAGVFCKRLFAATKQSLPQFNGNSKKVVTGHGIDIDYWLTDRDEKAPLIEPKEYNLVSVHRICRSKRLEIAIMSLKYLPEKYTLTVYGRNVENDYFKELCGLVKKEHLSHRVFFKGPVPMRDLINIYPNFRIMVNMAPETIDKTVLEGMLFGLYSVTTKANSKAIGLPVWSKNDEPETVAKFILSKAWEEYTTDDLQKIIKKNHSLSSLITKLNSYIKKGI